MESLPKGLLLTLVVCLLPGIRGQLFQDPLFGFEAAHDNCTHHYWNVDFKLNLTTNHLIQFFFSEVIVSVDGHQISSINIDPYVCNNDHHYDEHGPAAVCKSYQHSMYDLHMKAMWYPGEVGKTVQACLKLRYNYYKYSKYWCADLGHIPDSQQVETPCDTLEECDKVYCDEHKDVAIVGAGSAGAYSAYLLKNSGKSVGVYEYSNRVGGRLYSYKLPNTQHKYLELGYMMFQKTWAKNLMKITNQLNLNYSVFEEGLGQANKTVFTLRGISMSKWQAYYGVVPYSLTHEEKKNQANLMEYYLEKLTGYKIQKGITHNQLMNIQLHDGTYLYELSFMKFLDMAASEEGKAFVKDLRIFNLFNDDASVVQVYHYHYGSDFFDPEADDKWYSFDHGFQTVPKSLMHEFLSVDSKNDSLNLNMWLYAIRSKSNKDYVLHFLKTKTVDGHTSVMWNQPMYHKVCAKQVILALPMYAMTKLDWPPLKENCYKKAAHAIKLEPVSKVYMTFNESWWLNNEFGASVAMGGKPFQAMYDWGKSGAEGDSIMLASWAGASNTENLYNLQKAGQKLKGSAPMPNHVTKPMKNAIVHSVCSALDNEGVCNYQPQTTVSQFWMGYPYGGVAVTKAGYQFTDLVNTLRRPCLTDKVYVVGADVAWGALAQTPEGAFETAEHVHHMYFKHL